MSDEDRPEPREPAKASSASAGADEGSSASAGAGKSSTAPAGADPDATGRTGPLQFLKEVRGELRKVAWPNRKELVNYTIVVLVVSLILTLLVYGFDQVIRRAVIETLG